MQNKKDNHLNFSEILTKSIKGSYGPNEILKIINKIKKNNDIFLLYKINNLITERNLLQPNQRILIAVSGGQDSICILRILFQLKIKWNWKLGIIHCDHRWTSISKYQAEHVACLAVNLQINYHEGIAIESVQKEGRARIWRYNIIQTIAISYNYSAIITGHNASDRIETLLYNLTRGSGLHGLQAIKWKRYLFFSRLTQSVILKRKFSVRQAFFLRKLKYIKTFPNHNVKNFIFNSSTFGNYTYRNSKYNECLELAFLA
jgi:tRNA(Ile)-lysidine synthetase-like protein